MTKKVKKKRRKFIFKNHATKFRIQKVGLHYTYAEAHFIVNPSTLKLFISYEKAFAAMQRYSKHYYGEKAI